MRTSVTRFLHSLILGVAVAMLFPAPASASSITIVGGREESIDVACFPCRGQLGGIPVGTLGYSALDCPLTQRSALVMGLVLSEPSPVRFTFMGLDSWSYNQFFVDQDNDHDPFNDPPVFDIPRPADEPFPVRAPVTLWLPAGVINFGFRTAADMGGSTTKGVDIDTFSIFASCLPTPTDPNPRTCTQGYIGFADGIVFTANDDHQDLGVQFEAVPEPASLVLTAIGLFGVAVMVRRRRVC